LSQAVRVGHHRDDGRLDQGEVARCGVGLAAHQIVQEARHVDLTRPQEALGVGLCQKQQVLDEALHPQDLGPHEALDPPDLGG